MILLTGATGNVGRPLLRRLIGGGQRVRCLVRDPRRLGTERVRVQIALGDLGDPASFRNALRGVETVIHLAASTRDQPRGSIEELDGVATLRLLRAAERLGVERFVFASALGASLHSPARLMRAKALAEQAVAASSCATLVLAPSIVYSPGDPWLRLLERLSLLPALPVPGSGRALYQPVWAEDVAGCLEAALGAGRVGRLELVGPETLTHNAILRIALRSFGRPRPLLHVPLGVTRRALRALERLARGAAFATWDEAELLQVPMTSGRGTADAEALGVRPLAMGRVLGAG